MAQSNEPDSLLKQILLKLRNVPWQRICFDTFSLKYEMVHWNTYCSTLACRANFHHVFDWLPTIHLVRCSPSFLCLWDIFLKLGARPLSPEQVSLLSKDRALILSFSWCRLVHILGSCWSWKLHSCGAELIFVSLSFCPMTNFISKSYSFSKILSFGILKNVVCFKSQLVEIFCNLEALQFGHLCTWFYNIKLLPVCILVVLWDFCGVVSSV